MSTSYDTALEVDGNERPLLVGLDPVIRCSTHLTVTKMEWLLVGFDFALEASRNQELYLPLDLTSDGLDGAMFKCRATTVSHGVYEETITIAVKGISLPIGSWVNRGLPTGSQESDSHENCL